MSYNAAGQLAGWQNQPTSPTSTVSYLYDGTGQRVAMKSTVNGTVTTTAYIGTIEEVQTSGSTTQTTTYYMLGGKRVAASVNGTFYYFGYDAIGSQVAVLNATGSVIGTQLYSPYGSKRYSTGTLPTSIGFTGQRADSVTGLDYYNARYYDPVVGRFVSADTAQGNGQGMDPYAYVAGNPESRTDPTGTRFVTCAPGEDCGSPPPAGGGGGGATGGGGGGAYYPPVQPPMPPVQPPVRNVGATTKTTTSVGGGSGNPKTASIPHGAPPKSQADIPTGAQQIAFLLARYIQALRMVNLDFSGRNYAAGVYYFTEGDSILGAIVPFGLARSEGADHRDRTGAFWDAEQILMRQWISSGTAITALLTLEGFWAMGIHAQLHLVIYSQLEPCKYCQLAATAFMGGLTSAMNAMQLPAESTIPQREITLDIFGANNYGDDKDKGMIPGIVRTPNDITDYDHTEIWGQTISNFV